MLEPILPIAAAGLATSLITKTVADASQLDGATLVPLGLAIVAMIFVGRWIFTYSRDCERQRAELAAIRRMLKYLVRTLPQVNENDPYVREMVDNMEPAAEQKSEEKSSV